jgi:hypothetical protein
MLRKWKEIFLRMFVKFIFFVSWLVIWVEEDNLIEKFQLKGLRRNVAVGLVVILAAATFGELFHLLFSRSKRRDPPWWSGK